MPITTKIGLQNAIAARRHEIEQLQQENALPSTDGRIAYKNLKIIGLLAKLIDLDSKILETL